jgi:hypothetical protein
MRRGQALVVILMISLILGILLGGVSTFFRGQVQLLSKSAKDYLALCAAETGLNCVLAELRFDPQFVTHGNSFIPQDGWTAPAAHKDLLVGEADGLELDHSSRGVYSGRVFLRKTRVLGEFKVRMKLQSAKNSLSTKTVDESHRYFLIEAVGKVDDTCRKISAILERHNPGSYLAYDGSVLDIGAFGPYHIVPGILRRGRLYGQDLLTISRRGFTDAGTELLEMEKVSTPGHLHVKQDTFISFRNGKEERLKPAHDSSHVNDFVSFPEQNGKKVLGHFVLDGTHGGKNERFPPLNPQIYQDAKRPVPVILAPGCGFSGFSESKWRNPGKPEEVVYELDFGWEYQNKDDKVLLYAKVPLRIWGCPPAKATTIFGEKDIYIAGDFNANPDTPQMYDLAWRDYTDPPRNGTEKNAVMVLSQERIWFDYSQPILFLRNELENLIDYEIALRLGGKELSAAILAPIVYPPRFSTNSDTRLPMTALNFNALAHLMALPKEPPQIIPLTLAAIPMNTALKELREFFEPSADPGIYRNRFVVKSFLKRQALYEKIGAAGYMTGILTKGQRLRIIRTLLDEAQREVLEEEPDAGIGAWNMADRLFKLAFTHPKLGFRMPEMTVNALLIDSAELNARWDTSLGTEKVLNEIGNIKSAEARCFPYVFASETRILLRHLGGKMNLRTRPSKLFLDGKLRSDSFLLRRNLWDSTYVPSGGDYHPPYMPAAYSLCQWEDSSATMEEFKAF